MYEVFVSNPPVLPTLRNLVEPNAKVLVFEPTIPGYRKAIKWLKANPSPSFPVYRLVVPNVDGYMDTGDELVMTERRKAGEVVKIEIGDDTRSVESWPFKSESRILDFEMGLKSMLDRVLLRDAYEGYSLVQRAMAGLSEDRAIKTAMIEFDITQEEAEDQWCKMNQGNVPWGKNELQVLPYVLLNGPYPIAPEILYEGVKEYVRLGRVTPLPVKQPSCKGYIFVGETSKCQLSSDGNVVGLPYGISPTRFNQVNAMKKVKTGVYKSPCGLSTYQCVWDGKFAGGKLFPTLQDYWKWWVEETHKKMIDKLVEAEEDNKRHERKLEFMRDIHVGKKDGMQRWFLDEDMETKRARIARDYEGDFDLLNTPVGSIDLTTIFNWEIQSKPESAREFWLDRLRKRYG